MPTKTKRVGRSQSRHLAFRDAATADEGRIWKICACLIIAVLATYWRALDNHFVNFDDGLYIFNGHVDRGLTLEGFRWAFTDMSTGNWHPLTFLSHMLDVSLFGLTPAVHHLENVLWHTANSVLLFVAFWRMTGCLWRSALVSALFALHPLRVESVAWVSERKDVLSSFFYIAMVWAYYWYTRRAQSWRRYALVVVTLVLGLMAKAVLLTAPFLLLLLDYWPLMRTERWRVLIKEKVPLFGVVTVFSGVAFLAQKHAGATGQFENVTIVDRLSNAVVSYARYLGKIVWPHPLAVLYPYERDHAPLGVGACLLLLIGITALAVRAGTARFGANRRYVLTGWLWFLGTMVPMVGIVQLGWQAYADRYTYVPSIGIFVAVVWLVADLTRREWRPRVAGLTLVVLAAWAVTTSAQIPYWHDDLTLFEHAIQSTTANPIAQYHLGSDLEGDGHYADAVTHLREAVRILPEYYPSYYALGLAEEKTGNIPSAARNYSQAIRLKPDYAEAHYARAALLIETGDEQGAEPDFRAALKYGLAGPNAGFIPLAHDALGVIAANRGDYQGAIANFEEAVRVRPDVVAFQRDLANALAAQGRVNDAISRLERAVTAVGSDPSLTTLLEELHARK